MPYSAFIVNAYARGYVLSYVRFTLFVPPFADFIKGLIVYFFQ
jgi:hypothetical protein